VLVVVEITRRKVTWGAVAAQTWPGTAKAAAAAAVAAKTSTSLPDMVSNVQVLTLALGR
jgi:hypothetical protein